MGRLHCDKGIDYVSCRSGIIQRITVFEREGQYAPPHIATSPGRRAPLQREFEGAAVVGVGQAKLEVGRFGIYGIEGEAAGGDLVVAPVGDGEGSAGQGGVGHAEAGGEVDAPGGVDPGDGEVAADVEATADGGVAVEIEGAIGGDIAGLVEIGAAVGSGVVAAADAKVFQVAGVGSGARGHGGSPFWVAGVVLYKVVRGHCAFACGAPLDRHGAGGV